MSIDCDADVDGMECRICAALENEHSCDPPLPVPTETKTSWSCSDCGRTFITTRLADTTTGARHPQPDRIVWYSRRNNEAGE